MVFPQILGLALAQLALGAARGIFWPAAQSFASRLPGNRVQNLGTFTSFTKGGALIGIAIAGSAAVVLGIRVAFLGSSALSLLCFLIALRFPRWQPNQSDGGWSRAFKGLLPAVRRPFVLNNGLLAFLTAVPQALAQSFYPILLIRAGLSDQWASLLTAAQSLGMIIAGLLAAFLVGKLGSKRFALSSAILLAVAFVLTASKPLVWIGIAIFIAGLASGWLNVAFLNLVVGLSDEAERGTNLGMAQGYFVIAMMGTPALTGLVSTQIGLSNTFIWIGVGSLIITVLIAVLWRWAFSAPKPGLNRELGA
jgi:predicted MFS family arabinose efflux permease